MTKLPPPVFLVLALVACHSRPADQAAPPAPVDASARLEEVRALLASERPYEALAELDEVQAVAPEDAEAWYLRGQAFEATAGLGQSSLEFYVDARDAYERAAELGHGPDAWLGASRAARACSEPERALELARAGLASYEASEPPPTLEQPLELTLVEALFGVYVARRQAGADSPVLYVETGERLQALARARPDDPWPHAQLANLYQWGGQFELALQAQEEVLRLTPDDQAAHARAVELARAAGGSEAVLALYERFGAAHPDSALVPWFTGVETFQRAAAELDSGGDSIPSFEEAEALFARCRELEPEFDASCKGYEAVCRAGVGWALYNGEDLEGATEAFLSMNELFPGAIEWQIEGSVLSGVLGLQFVADRYARRGEGELDLEGKPEAAAVFDLLREQRPEDANFANNAGFFHRDACVILELRAEDRFRAADGLEYVRVTPEDEAVEDARWELREVEVTPAEAAAAREEGEALRARAMEHAEKSYRAYQDAARLAPDDVRILNDAALVMLYHVRKDPDEIERLLARAIELGERQTADPELSPEELDALREAWGDACQNMGLLHLTMKDDPAGARPWFERSFEIGPRPRIDRAWITDRGLPACAAAEAGEPDPFADLDPRLWLHLDE